jgi:hypothetical protein
MSHQTAVEKEGLREGAAMPSGSGVLRREAFTWYGDVPIDWNVDRFKRIATIRNGQVDPEDDRYKDLPLFAPNHIESGTGRLLGVESADAQGAESGKFIVESGEVVYSKIRPALRKVMVAPFRGLQAALQAFRESQSRRDACLRALEIHERVSEFEKLLAESEKAPKRERAEGPSTHVGANEAEQFSQEVETLLRAWQFPNLDRVTFSEDDQDVVISGQRRASHGKGVRAITHAAFNVGILTYCRSRSMPHPGVVLVDSPLIVYRQPDQGEGNFSRDVKDAFYRSLAATCGESQIVILENDPPPTDLDGSVNIIEFTGTDRGRWGFIPKPQANE